MESDKVTRILELYNTLIQGGQVNKTRFALEHEISERSAERDIEDIRLFLSECYTGEELLFDRTSGSYHLKNAHTVRITEHEVMIFAKMLLDSRAFRQDELEGLLIALLSVLPHDAQLLVTRWLRSEDAGYKPVNHQKAILKVIYDLHSCILQEKKIALHYSKAGTEPIERLVSPIAVVFSEHYYYLVAFREDSHYDAPAFYRIDRIVSFQLTDTRYSQKLKSKYNVSQMRQALLGMTAGELTKVTLRCTNAATEAALDWLPNATIVEQQAKYSVLAAKVFEGGFIRWVLSQGAAVEVLSPAPLREKIVQQLNAAIEQYQAKTTAQEDL